MGNPDRRHCGLLANARAPHPADNSAGQAQGNLYVCGCAYEDRLNLAGHAMVGLKRPQTVADNSCYRFSIEGSVLGVIHRGKR